MKLSPLSLLVWCIASSAGAASTQPATQAPQEVQTSAWREQAVALEHGHGVRRDPVQAMALYCKAALAGDADSRYRLGWMYANGRGTERNDAYASFYFHLAAEQGHPQSANMLKIVGLRSEEPPCVVQAAQAEAQSVAAQARARHEARYRDLADNAQRRKILAIVDRLAPEYGIHPGLAFAVIRAESNFNPQAVSHKNAQGLMQLIPETAARFRVRKPFDPEQNRRGGLAYLRWLLAYFQGDVALAVAAYNAGEGAVDKHRGIPPYAETRGYLSRIQEIFDLQQHPFDAKITGPSRVVNQTIVRR
ncbi:MAG TPA: lytic transglycosylase domain-containing protein [Hydrogenophaga sp.]|nr:lytic transglycosylase domain-containing protein [Hydrogenophaga sp.]